MSDQNTFPNAAELQTVKTLTLNAIFIVHFVLITWGTQGYWSPSSYLFYNIFFFATLIWSLHSKENEEPVLLCLIINGLAILFDLLVLCIYFPNKGSSEKFSGAMAILNMLLRPVSCLALYKHWRDRVNGPPTDFDFSGSSSAKKTRNYQDVESQSYPWMDNLNTPYQ